MAATQRGVPVVVSAPSGGGKTTLCHKLIEQLGHVAFSVSHTTRPMRAGERDGVDYHFVSDAQFDDLVGASAFVEWAHVHGCRYGTSRLEAVSRLSRGLDVLFDIDVQGGRQIVDQLENVVLVFILPPSLATLEQRLRQRHSDAPESIARRLAAARSEIEQAAFYHYWVVNDDLDRAVGDLKSILTAERLQRMNKDLLKQRLLDGGSL